MYLIIILTVLIVEFIFGVFVDLLNLKSLSPVLPQEFSGYYDENKYKKSQNYLKINTKFGFIKGSFDILLIIIVILTGGFNILDKFIGNYGFGDITRGIIFISSIIIISSILTLPFSIYQIFKIEEKFGFNKTSLKTFILDLIKSLFLLIIIGVPSILAVLWFFEKTGKLAPLLVWIFIVVFQLIILFLAPVLIMPLFNKYIPLEDGELKTIISEYAKKEGFRMKGVFTMDGSKRSTKSNAFFTGFGRFRRIVLYDTLIEKHNPQELLTIIAHEMGHYKLKHIFKMIFSSFLELGITLIILTLFIKNEGLFAAFKMEHLSVYASLVFFGFLYSPVSYMISIISNYFSRKYEYEADEYAVKTTNKPEVFIEALKKLSVDNLSNLTPHRLKVFIEYSHPPILERIKTIRKINGEK